MKNTFSAAIVGLCLMLLGLGAARSAEAQPAVKQPAVKQRIVKQPVKEASRTSGYLGIVADDREDYGQGVRVLAVRPGGPAEKAGFQQADLIISVAEIRVRQMADLADVLEGFLAGDSLAFDLLRDGKLHTLKVTLGRPPASSQRPVRPPKTVATPVPEVRAAADAAVEDREKQPAAEPQLPAADAAKPPADNRALIEQLLRRIEQLERRVGQLERALSAVKKG